MDLEDVSDDDLLAEVTVRRLGIIEDFSTDDLLGELERRGALAGSISDSADFELATDALRRGNKHEALLMLERALGCEWVGAFSNDYPRR